MLPTTDEALVLAKFVPVGRHTAYPSVFAYNNGVSFVYQKRFEFSPDQEKLREMLGCDLCELLKVRKTRSISGEHQLHLNLMAKGIFGKIPKRSEVECQITADDLANDIMPECEKRFKKTQQLRMNLPLMTDGDNEVEIDQLFD
ncbi:MAG: hypothetical protein WAV41_05365 [Microgenomates group bacterium]